MTFLTILLSVSVTMNILFAVAVILLVHYLRSQSHPNRATRAIVLPPKTIDIYTLLDPINGHVKYVGLSNNVQRRINEHIRRALSYDALSMWLKELHSQGLSPRVKIVATGIDIKEAGSIERQFIVEYIRSGEQLLNSQSVRTVSGFVNRINIEGPDG